MFDTLTPLEQWVERGIAPASILAVHATGTTVDRTRPLCPYPQVARYVGTGSIDNAANFTCVTPGSLDFLDTLIAHELLGDAENN
jgi:feruloyl esterase